MGFAKVIGLMAVFIVLYIYLPKFEPFIADYWLQSFHYWVSFIRLCLIIGSVVLVANEIRQMA